MGKLREQILTETCGACDTDGCGHSKASECPFASNLADRILNLFKSQVEGLTVIHAYSCTTNLAIIGATCNCGAEAQVQADKDKLKGGRE